MAFAGTRGQRGCVLPAGCVVEGEFRRPRGNVKVSVHGGSFQLGEHRHSSPFPLAMGRERRDHGPGCVAAAVSMRMGFAPEDMNGEGFRRPSRGRSEEHTSELQSLMRISYAVFCLQQKIYKIQNN